MAIIKHKVRIGLYTTGLKAYWPQFAGMRERLEGYGRFIAGELAAMGEGVKASMSYCINRTVSR